MPEKNISFSSFDSFKQVVSEINAKLVKLKEISERLRLSGNIASIDEVLKKLSEDCFDIAIIGEFKRGKSTLINALLGEDVLPMDVLPTTATINRITYSTTPYVQIKFKDGREERIAIEQLNSYVTKLTDEAAETAKTVEEATVHYPVEYCKNNVNIIDTPGINDDSTMTDVTMTILPKVDAALMVIMAQSPFADSERAFLESKVLSSDLGRVLFVVTGIDLLDDEDIPRVLGNITARIEQYVMAKAAKTFGEDSKEYETYMRKIGKVQVFGLSAKKALRAKLAGDDKALEQSRFLIFERELERSLTEDRGAVKLSVPVSRILGASVEILKAIDLRDNAFSMKKAEFEEKYEQAMVKIETIRQNRSEEFNRIDQSAGQTHENLKPLIESLWPAVISAAERVLDNYPLGVDDVKKSSVLATQEKIMFAVREQMAEAAQIVNEKIQNQLSASLDQEVADLSDFHESFMVATSNIQGVFAAKTAESNIGKISEAAAGTVLNTLTIGGGSIYAGFKQAGIKGALVGGASGLIGSAGVFIGAVLATAALPITGALMLSIWAASALGGTFVSKVITRKFFSEDNVNNFRNNFKKAALEQIEDMKANDNYSEQVRQHVFTVYAGLKDNIERETENILIDTQDTLDKLREEYANDEDIRKKEQEYLNTIIPDIEAVMVFAESVNAQLAEVMKRS